MKKTHRYVVSLTDTAQRAFEELHKQSDGENKNRVFKDAIMFAYAHKMYAYRYGVPMISPQTPPQRPPKKKEYKHLLLEYIPSMGGDIDENGIVTYTRYEKLPTGRIVKSTRSEPLKTLPQDFDTLRRLFLGPFLNLTEAEEAYETQSEAKQDRGLNRDDSVQM